MARSSAALIALLAIAPSVAAQPQALPADKLKAIKAATVFVKVTVANLHGSGSGFVVHATKEYGLVVTNEHVVEPGDRIRDRVPRGARPSVEVVFHSGQDGVEWSAKAEVLYTNKDDDLALLRVKAVKPIPAPISLTGADKLPETTPVYVCGFPFGEDLAEGDKNPEISIGVASISSNRTDANGQVVTVQLNGALNPGNSGGPVVAQDGKLVGVAVRSLLGAGIGFAVPPHKVRSAVQDIHFAAPTVTRVDGKLRIVSKFVDAFGNLKNPAAHLAPAPNAWNAPNTVDLSKRPDATRHVPKIDVAESTATTELPAPNGPHLWLQYSWTDGNGTLHRSVPVRVTIEEAKPVLPRPSPSPPPAPVPLPGQRPGFVRPDGTAIAPADLETKLGATPKNQIDLAELNRTAINRIGQRQIVEVLTTGIGRGYGDGGSLNVYDRNFDLPTGLDCVVDPALESCMRGSNFLGKRIAVRLTGTVRKPADPKPWQLLVVDQIDLLGKDGGTLATFRRESKHEDVRLNRSQVRVTERVLLPAYPAGGTEAQTKLVSNLQAFKPELIGQDHKLRVNFFGRSRTAFQVSGVERVSFFACRFPDDSLPGTIQLTASTEMIDELWKGLQKCPDHQLPCAIEFRAVGVRREPNRTPALECFITAVSYTMSDKPNDPIRIVERSAKLPATRSGTPPSDPKKPGDESPFDFADLATTLPETPAGQIDVDELNRTSSNRIGERLTVDVLTTGSVGGYGDGPSIHGYNRNRSMPPGLDFVVDAKMARAMESRNFQGRHVAVRLTGTVQLSKRTTAWRLFVVEEIGLIGKGGEVIAKFRGGAKLDAEPVAPKTVPPPRTVPSPRPGTARPAGPPLPPEPYPLGSLEAQNAMLAELKKLDPSQIGKRYRMSVYLSAVVSTNFRRDGTTVQTKQIVISNPDTRTVPISTVTVHAKLTTGEELSRHYRIAPERRLPCVVEFEIDQLLGPDQHKYSYGCRLLSINFADPSNAGQRVEFHDDWPEFRTAKPVPPREAAAPDAMPPRGKAEPQPARESEHPIGLILATGVVGLLVIGGVVFAILRGGSKDRRAESDRDREEDDERPRRRGSRRT